MVHGGAVDGLSHEGAGGIRQAPGSAKYVRFENFLDRAVAPGQSGRFYPWPYVEAVTMAEATNDLAFMVTGIYGKPSPTVGAPLRVALPWKYGFQVRPRPSSR